MGRGLRKGLSGNIWLVPAALVAVPFLSGAVVIAWDIIRLPETAGRMTVARHLGGALFSFGLALSLLGCASALTASSAYRRALGTAAALFGCAHLALALVVRKIVADTALTSGPSMLPLAAPVLLWAYSVWLAVKALTVDRSRSGRSSESSVSDQPLSPQSPP